MSRSKARKNAFGLLFQLDFLGWHQAEEVAELYFEQLETLDEPEKINESSKKYIIAAYQGVAAHLEEIDEAIGKAAKGWSIDRMNKVDLAILRLAAYELRYDAEVPSAVAIDEAVELAKTYSADGAPAFINGILGKLAGE